MKYIKIAGILLISFILLLYFFKNVNFSEVFRIINRINPLYPLVFVTISFIQYFIRAYRWGMILKPSKNGIRLLTLYNFTMIGYLINFLIPGRIGEPAKGILLARQEKFPQSYGLASIVLERLIDFFWVVIFLLISLFFIKSNNSHFLNQIQKIPFYLIPVIVFIFFLFYLLNTKKMYPIIERMIAKFLKIIPLKIRAKTFEFIMGFIRGLHLNLRFLDFMALFFVSGIVWFALIPGYWFLLKGFNIHLGLFEILPYFSIIVISASIPTPGMAGSIDTVSKIALTKLFNIPVDTAVAYTILFHFLVLVQWTLFGFLAFIAQGLSLKTIKNIKGIKNNEMS